MSSELAKPTSAVGTLKGLIDSPKFKEQLAASLPKHLTPDRFARIAITALTRTPKLAECTQTSLFKCLLELSALGLEPDGRSAHLIPYRDNKREVTECTLQLDYKGIAELVMRSGLVSSIHADKVCESDTFKVDRGSIVQHEIDYRKARVDAYAYYVLIKFKDGSEKSEVMTRAECEAIRKRSKAGSSGPWVTDFDEMAKKTVFKRASKWLPLSPEIRDAFEKDHDQLEEIRRERVVTSARNVPIDPFNQLPPAELEDAPEIPWGDESQETEGGQP